MFYDNFLELCRERGKSPAAVTREIGLNNSSSTAWKRGATPKGETLQKLANYFGVSVDYLLGMGQRVSAVAPSRRIFEALHNKKWSLEQLSIKTRIPVETLQKFALGDKVENGRECLERVAAVLNANPAYLMGWTNHEDEEIEITPGMWDLSDNDPDAAHWLKQFIEDEEYQRGVDEGERQQGKSKDQMLLKVGDSYCGGDLRIANIEKDRNELIVTLRADEGGTEFKGLISLFEILQSMSEEHGVSIDGLTELAKMVQAVAAKEPLQEGPPVLPNLLPPQEDDKP